jgi:hypothetical protein
MSTNPATKTYHRRIKRLAQKLSDAVQYDGASPASLDQIIEKADPTMPREMRLQAIALAVVDCESWIRMGEGHIARARAGINRLREYRPHVHRGSLRLVSSSANR